MHFRPLQGLLTLVAEQQPCCHVGTALPSLWWALAQASHKMVAPAPPPCQKARGEVASAGPGSFAFPTEVRTR